MKQIAFNVLFTNLPIIFYGFLERDVKPDTALRNPQLYLSGQRKESFDTRAALSWGLNALLHVLVVFFVPMTAMVEAATVDLYVAGTVVLVPMVVAINIRLLLITSNINKFTVIFTALRWLDTHTPECLVFCVLCFHVAALMVHACTPNLKSETAHAHRVQVRACNANACVLAAHGFRVQGVGVWLAVCECPKTTRAPPHGR